MRISLVANCIIKTLPEWLMKQYAAITAAFGIGHARTPPMKSLYSDLHLEPGALGNVTVRAAERFQKICIVFEDDDSARSVKIPIKNGHVPAKASTPEFQNYYKLAYPQPSPRHEY